MRDWIPILEWLPQYRRSWLLDDVVAGLTVWAVIVPLALAYASIAGVDPVVGLYTIPLALLGYAVLGGSRLLVVGPDAAVAVLSGGIVASLAAGGGNHLELTIALSLVTGATYFVFFCLKMGWSADLVPEPVLKGFVEGIVWLTIFKQIAVLLGIELKGSSEGFFGLVAEMFATLPTAHLLTTGLGIASILALLAGRWLLPRIPGPIIVLAGSILLVHIFRLDALGVSVIGDVSVSDAHVGLPTSISFQQIIALVPGAIAIVVLGFTKSLAALRRAAEATGQPIDPDRELLAIGASNVGAGLGGGYAVAGALTPTAVSVDSGGKSQIANLVAGLLCLLTIILLLPLLAGLPKCALAAIIVVAFVGLSDLRYFRDLWAVSRFEFFVAAAALLGVLLFGVMPGVLIGVVLALFKLAYGIHSPVTTVVGRTPSGAFVDIDEHPDARELPGLLIWRQYGPLTFLNARVLSNELRAVAKDRKDLRVVVFDATTSAGVDTSAANALLAVRKDLAADGVEFWIVNPRQKGWKLVSAILEAKDIELPRVFESLSEAQAQFEKSGSAKGGQ